MLLRHSAHRSAKSNHTPTGDTAVKIVGAVDIGGTKIAVGLVNGDGLILGRLECATEPAAGFDPAMARVKTMMHGLLSESGAILDGIGVACPGPLDPISGIIGDVGTLVGWENGNLAAELAAEFCIPVAVENDADAAALAEAARGAGRGSTHLIYVTVSTGIGGGIVLGGQLYRGAAGAHPEIGHQVLDASGPQCYCKARGCWESLASGTALAEWFQQQHTSHDPVTAADVCLLAEHGDPLALRAMDRQGYYLGLGLTNLITLFTPDCIVLGGGVMKSSRLFLPRALEVIRTLCTQVPAANTRITLTCLGEDTGLAGAAQAWFLRYGGASPAL